jgi:cell division septation protein DedD
MGTYQNTRVVGNSMADDAMADTEITLGVGQLLGLFFGLVILCGLSLGTGYWLGRSSAKQSLSGATAVAAAPGAAPSADGKPGAAQLASQAASPDGQPKAADCAGGENCPVQAVATANAATPGAAAPYASTPAATNSNTRDLTFYKTVQQKDNAHPQLAPPEPAPSIAPPAAADPRSTLGAGYLVQIAAVRNPDDAKLLSGALQKQQYPVIVTQPGDKLFHVQVGPYADIKEADAIRARLIGAGYNAFLKH